MAREAGTQVPPGKKKGLGVAPQAEARSTPSGFPRSWAASLPNDSVRAQVVVAGLCAPHAQPTSWSVGLHTIPSYTLFCFSPFFFLFYNPASCPCSSQGIEVHHSSAALNFAHQTFRALPSTATSQTSSAILQFVGFSSLHYSWAARDKAMCDVAKTCLQV